MATVVDLQRVSAKALSDIILSQTGEAEPTVAVIDVRDDDYIGGHIKGALNVPSRALDAMMPTLVQKLDGKAAVVFHCALSQQRGPSAALSYIRERAAFRAKNSSKDEGVTAEKAEPAKPDGNVDAQKVYVLDQGFVGWQELYGTDERLTEGYRKELWSDGDMG